LSNRYTYIYGFGVNRFETNGSILVVSKSYELVDDIAECPIVSDNSIMPDKDLVKLKLHYYGHEIIPISPTKLKMRSLFMIDPQMNNLPDRIVNWGAKQFTHYMYFKLLALSKKVKGTKYESRIESGDSRYFYEWAYTKINDYYKERGWQTNQARL
jgi:hypothetical protein